MLYAQALRNSPRTQPPGTQVLATALDTFHSFPEIPIPHRRTPPRRRRAHRLIFAASA
jgi:hypothetical protein